MAKYYLFVEKQNEKESYQYFRLSYVIVAFDAFLFKITRQA